MPLHWQERKASKIIWPLSQKEEKINYRITKKNHLKKKKKRKYQYIGKYYRVEVKLEWVMLVFCNAFQICMFVCTLLILTPTCTVLLTSRTRVRCKVIALTGNPNIEMYRKNNSGRKIVVNFTCAARQWIQHWVISKQWEKQILRHLSYSWLACLSKLPSKNDFF